VKDSTCTAGKPAAQQAAAAEKLLVKHQKNKFVNACEMNASRKKKKSKHKYAARDTEAGEEEDGGVSSAPAQALVWRLHHEKLRCMFPDLASELVGVALEEAGGSSAQA